jgi:hypothetical protein
MLIPTTIPSVSSVSAGNTLYVDAVNGNDSTGLRGRLDKPFLTPGAAATAAQTGDTIQLGPGTFNLGTQGHVKLPANVNLNGSGMNGGGAGGTTIQGSGNYSSIGCIINPGSNSVISNLFIQGTTTVGTFCWPIGCHIANGDNASTNVTLLNLQTAGWSDGLYFKNATSNFPTQKWTCINCIFNSNFDAVSTVHADVSSNWPLTADFYNCAFLTTWASNTSASERRGFQIGGPGVLFRVFGGRIFCASNASDSQTTIGVLAQPGSAIELYGTSVLTQKLGSGNRYDFSFEATGAAASLTTPATIKIGPGTSYDPSTINDSTSNINVVTCVTSQVFGAAGTTISAGSALGTGGSVAATIATTNGVANGLTGDDERNQITLVTGHTSVATGTLATITFGSPRAYSYPVLTPANAAAAALSGATAVYITNVSGTSFDLHTGTSALSADTTYIWNIRN